MSIEWSQHSTFEVTLAQFKVMGLFKRMRDRMEEKLGGRYGATLFSIIVALICYPLTSGSKLADIVLGVWLFASLGLLVVALRPERISKFSGIVFGGGTLLLPAVRIMSSTFGVNANLLYLFLLPCSTVFFFYCAWLIVKSIFAEKEVTADMLCGAVISYLLLGIAWTGLYGLIVILDPNAFTIQVGNDDSGGALLYYSFVTLTTLGYGDILPLSEMARTAAFLEAVAGVMFAAIFVAALVGNWKKN